MLFECMQVQVKVTATRSNSPGLNLHLHLLTVSLTCFFGSFQSVQVWLLLSVDLAISLVCFSFMKENNDNGVDEKEESAGEAS